MLSTFCKWLGLGRELASFQVLLAAKKKEVSFIIQFYSRRQEPEGKFCNVEPGWYCSQLHFRLWASQYHEYPWRTIPKLKPDSTESQSNLDEFVLFYCLQFVFIFHIALGWSTIPPSGPAHLVAFTLSAEKSRLIRDCHSHSRNRRNTILSHHHSQTSSEGVMERAAASSALRSLLIGTKFQNQGRIYFLRLGCN